MIEKSEIERLLRMGLFKVLTTDTFYHYTMKGIMLEHAGQIL